jgi:Reverse transcriptase (RNA-dependent DNA polymerase)
MKPGEDYFDTHTSVVISTTIRILLTLAAALGMIVELADLETAYLDAALREFIHAEQPPYFELKDREKYVLLLKQALYGLPKSGFEWAATLRTALEAIGFHSIADDDNLYVNNPSNSNSNYSNERVATIFIAVYVDDLVIASKDQSAIDTTIHNVQPSSHPLSYPFNTLKQIHPQPTPKFPSPLTDHPSDNYPNWAAVLARIGGTFRPVTI